jgi:hypothetical protein
MSKRDDKEKDLDILELFASFEQRLAALERLILKSGESKPILEKIRHPTHALESNAKLMTDAGITDVVKVPVCSVCHGLLKEGDHFFVCHHCESVLCDLHAIIFGNKAHCEEDFRRNHIDLSRRDYKTLVCTANGIDDVDKIAELTSMLSDDVKQSLARLFTSNLITQETKFFGLLKETKPTDDGLMAISVYRQFIYGRDEDMELFGKTLRKYLSEEKGTSED